MQQAFLRTPFFLKMGFVMAAAMLVPAVFAAVQGDYFSFRMFFYSAVLGAFGFGLLALALSNQRLENSGFDQLIQIGAVFAILPVFLAVPVFELGGGIPFRVAFLDMVSALTTTGLVVYDANSVPDTVHFWRALVAWIGGGLIWVIAASVLAPLNLGGYEVSQAGRNIGLSHGLTDVDRARLLGRSVAMMVPPYVFLTLMLWSLLTLTGSTGLVSFIHALSVISTSGIAGPVPFSQADSGFLGEATVLFFWIFAISHVVYQHERFSLHKRQIFHDPEFRMAAILVAMVSGALFVRHWFATLGDTGGGDIIQALQALWGGMFTVASFLTTTGYVSEFWGTAQQWSGLETPGIVFMGMALIGGGFATTAGGVKLIRVYALYQSVLREFDRMEHPSSVGQSRGVSRNDLRKGGFIAWVFFMLFVVAIALFTMIFSLLGQEFEHAITFAIATLTTTGPILQMSALGDWVLKELSLLSTLAASIAMILGRLEILVVLALVSPSAWRR